MAKSTDPDLSKPLFTDWNSFAFWLERKPNDWVVSLAMRSALRAGVLLWLVRQPYMLGRDVEELLLQSHRALFILHSTSGDNTQRQRAAAYAINASNAATNAATAANAAYAAYVPAAYAANAAAYAANAAANAANAGKAANARSAASNAVANAGKAANATANAAATAAANADANAAWTELEQDAQYLTLGVKRSDLLSSPLWREWPSWVDQRFKAAREEEWAQSPFNLWLAWYRLVLLGEPTDTVIAPNAALDLAFAADAFWTPDLKRSPEQIMREICERVGWDWEKTEIEPLPQVEDHTAVQTETFNTDVQGDAPADEDGLERRPFARALANRIKAFPRPEGGNGLAINLHAPWGEGKTSVLKMIEAELARSANDETGKDWIVVHFNAWDHEGRRPPWWAMLETVYRDLRTGLKFGRSQLIVGVQWARWSFMGNQFPMVAATLAALLFAFIVSRLELGSDAWKIATSVMTGFLTLGGAAFLFARGLVFGAKQYAEHHEVMTRDPLGRVRKQFANLINCADRPVCIMIDDLDRCDADFVVDLLEGIQTAFRHDDVVYVVAADRKWIKAAFEHRYKTAFGQVEGLGQPLGYLFLDKIFQDSAPLPIPPEAVQIAYWNRVIGQEALTLAERQEEAETLAKTEAEAKAELSSATTAEEVSNRLGGVLSDKDRSDVEKRAWRNTAYESVVQSAEIERAAQHGLKDLHAIIPFNPRALKRLANTLTLRIAEEVRAGRRVHEKALARWVVVEFSFPELADLLTAHPDWVKHVLQQEQHDPKGSVPDALKPYLGVQAIVDIFSKTDEGLGEETMLKLEDVRIITQGQV